MELRSYLSYRRIRSELTYWRTQSGIEVDFLVGSSAAIEVKASNRVSDRDLRGLRALAEEDGFHSRVPRLLRRARPAHRRRHSASCTGARSLRNCGATPFPGSASQVELDIACEYTYTYTYGGEDDID